MESKATNTLIMKFSPSTTFWKDKTINPKCRIHHHGRDWADVSRGRPRFMGRDEGLSPIFMILFSLSITTNLDDLFSTKDRNVFDWSLTMTFFCSSLVNTNWLVLYMKHAEDTWAISTDDGVLRSLGDDGLTICSAAYSYRLSCYHCLGGFGSFAWYNNTQPGLW